MTEHPLQQKFEQARGELIALLNNPVFTVNGLKAVQAKITQVKALYEALVRFEQSQITTGK
jgi:hypothetical protein